MDHPDDVGQFFSRLVLENQIDQTQAVDVFVQKVFGSSADLLEKRIEPEEHSRLLDAHAKTLLSAIGDTPLSRVFVTEVFKEVVRAASGEIPPALLTTRLSILKRRVQQGVAAR
jgi:hypothetical protein